MRVIDRARGIHTVARLRGSFARRGSYYNGCTLQCPYDMYHIAYAAHFITGLDTISLYFPFLVVSDEWSGERGL